MHGLNEITLGPPTADTAAPEYPVVEVWQTDPRVRVSSSLGHWLDVATGEFGDVDLLGVGMMLPVSATSLASGLSFGGYSWERSSSVVSERSSERSGGTASSFNQTQGVGEPGTRDQAHGQTTPLLPYTALIQAALARGEITAARTLLSVAISNSEPTGPLMALARLLLAPSVEVVARRESTRTAEMRWLEEHAASHRGYWVALRGATLLGAEDTLPALLAKVAQLRLEERPLIHRL